MLRSPSIFFRSTKHAIESLYSLPMRKNLIREIIALDIESAGVDSKGVPFVKLKDGPVFYGNSPSFGDRMMFRLGGNEIKKKLPVGAMSVAQSIVVSYLGGGLKYRGPSKQKFYEVQEGDTVAEMGAFIGFYAMKLSQQVGPTGKVIAIEPIPHNREILAINLQENNIKNVTVVPKGVWNSESICEFNLGITGRQSNSLIDIKQIKSGEVKAEVSTLDTIFSSVHLNKLNFAIIQLNGVEYEALQGMKNSQVENLAIAARYSRPDGSSPVPIINEELLHLGYKNIVIEKGGFIFASKSSANV